MDQNYTVSQLSMLHPFQDYSALTLLSLLKSYMCRVFWWMFQPFLYKTRLVWDWKLSLSAILFLLFLWCRLGCLQNLVADLCRFAQSKQRKSKTQNLRHLNSIQISSKKFSKEFIQNCDGNLHFYQKSQNIREKNIWKNNLKNLYKK